MSTPNTLNQAYELYKQKPDDPLGVEAFGSALLAFVTKAVKGEAAKRKESIKGDLEDVIMNTIVKVWEHLEDFDPKKSLFSTYVSNIMLNDLIDSDRKLLNRNEIPLTPDMLAPSSDKRDINIALKKLIDKLNNDDKVFIYHYLEGMSEKELNALYGKGGRWSNDKLNYLKEKLHHLACSNV